MDIRDATVYWAEYFNIFFTSKFMTNKIFTVSYFALFTNITD